MLSASERPRPSDPKPLYASTDVLPPSPRSLNIPNVCDNSVKKLVSEIRKCYQLQRDFVLLTPNHYMLVQTCSHPRHVVYISQIYVLILLRN